jgi:hypothetical protein
MESKITKAEIRKWKKVLKDARRRPSLIRTRDYLQASLMKPDLYTLHVEMGPSCNLRCPICLADCGPDKEGLPKSELVEKVLSQARSAGIDNVQLTDGEPIREENRDVLGVTAEYSSKIPLVILTNGVFASDKESTVRWFEFLKGSGLDPSVKGNRMVISFGKPYDVPSENYHNINQAFGQVFPNYFPGDFLRYRLINLGDGEDNIRRHNEVIKSLNEVFGERRNLRTYIKEGEFCVSVYPTKGPSIKLKQQGFVPVGRGSKLNIADHLYPHRELSPSDLTIEQRAAERLILVHDGGLDFVPASVGFDRQRAYGDVFSSSLNNAMGLIRRDELFQAYKVGGSGFIYYIAQKIDPKFKVNGKTRDDVLIKIFHNERIQEGIREYVHDSKDFVDSYFGYVNSLDLRKGHKV